MFFDSWVVLFSDRIKKARGVRGPSVSQEVINITLPKNGTSKGCVHDLHTHVYELILR